MITCEASDLERFREFIGRALGRAVELFETVIAPLAHCEQPARFRF